MQIDFLLLGDAAEVQAGKLYLLGGGWSVLRLGALPARMNVALAAGVLVDWEETERKHAFRLAIERPGGGGVEVAMEVRGQLEQGRPAGLPGGTAQRAILSASFALEVVSTGMHVAVAEVAGADTVRTAFHVLGRDG